jgi:hypothetical protein
MIATRVRGSPHLAFRTHLNQRFNHPLIYATPKTSSYLLYVPAFFPDMDLSPYPNVQAYMQR